MTWHAWLAERPLAVIATTGPDGTPHAVPVEVVVDGDKVYSWCKSGSVRLFNIARTGRAAIVAYKGHSFVMVRGAVRAFGAEDSRYERITRMFLDKYEREEAYGNDMLVEIAPERVTVERVD